MLVFFTFNSNVSAQDQDSLSFYTSEKVVVTSFKDSELKRSPLNISSIDIDSLTLLGNYNLTDLLAEQAGVEMLSSGNGISKPIIRGLSGNRVLILMSGLKFDNQQWQEEHGLGLSDIGLSNVEIIKGPMSILYGSEAVAGVINLIEEKKPHLDQNQFDIGCNLYANTLGAKFQVGYKSNKGSKWWRIRVGIENHGDYSDGSNKRVLNSRFDGYYLKGSFGFKKNNWVSTNNYLSSFNRFGFIFNDVYDYIEPDERSSRVLNNFPTHLVLLNILSSENKIFLKNNSKINLNLGFQSNERMENEGGGAISLNMHLLTGQYLLKWDKEINKKHRIIISNLGSFENNTNYGIRKIVPDANMQESNISFYASSKFDRITIENGIGFGEKYVETKLTPNINDDVQLKEAKPLKKLEWYYNFFSGLSFYPNKTSYFKLNLSSGIRIPNLAELSSDGLHEGIYTYEIGDPNLKNEQSFAANLLFHTGNHIITFSVSPFYNYFTNFIYLAPTTEQWFGFPVYRFKQQDARQYGFEAGFKITIPVGLSLEAQYAGMESKTSDGNFTPYIPAQKITSTIKYVINTKKKQTYSVYLSADNYLDQNHTAPNEIGTSNYMLIDGGISSQFSINKHHFQISFNVKNMLNESYYSHLSRFKYLGINNTGRNFILGFKYIINQKQK